MAFLAVQKQAQNQAHLLAVKMKLKQIQPLTKEYLENIGLSWHTDKDGSEYVANELVEVSEDEANAYYDACNELYDMFINAAEHVIENELFHELGIPFNLINSIKLSWQNDVHWHLYGRFDLAGGLDGKPIKLIEFNADTPTSLFESAIIQWALLKFNKMDENSQFNNIYEAIKENFKRLVVLDGDTEEFGKFYEGWKILFSSYANDEDENTTRLLETIANEAGFNTDFCYINEVQFSDEEGIFKDGENYEFFFKLIPWENIAIEEGELALILENIIKNQKAIILNPAYTLLFQSKGILKILWDLYPNHPLLLKCDDKELDCDYVKKPLFGREGENVSIVKNGIIIEQKDGEYGNFNSVFQEYAELNTDESGNSFQAGVFFAYEACGLGFRKGGKILDNYAKFVGHYIK